MQEYVREINIRLILKAIKINIKTLLFFMAILLVMLAGLIFFVYTFHNSVYYTVGAVQINNNNPNYANEQSISMDNNNRDNIINTNVIMATQSEIQEALIKSGYTLEPVIKENHLDIRQKQIHLSIMDRINRIFCADNPANKWKDKYCKFDPNALVIDTFNVSPEYLNKKFTLKVTAEDSYSLYLQESYVFSAKVGKTVTNGGISIGIKSIKASTGSQFSISQVSMDRAIKDLSANITIEPIVVGKNFVPPITGILKISLLGNKPAVQARIVNDIIDQLKSTALTQQSIVLDTSINFVESQIGVVLDKLQQSQNNMVDFQSSHNIVSLDEQQKDYIQQLTALEQNILDNKITITQFSKLYASKHPVMIDLYTQQESLMKKKASIDSALQKLPKSGAVFLNLKRNLEVYQQLYTFLLNKKQDLKMKLSGLTSPVKVLYYASRNVGPVTDTFSPKLIAGAIFIVIVLIIILFFHIIFIDNNDPWFISTRLKSSLLTIFPYRPKNRDTIYHSVEITISYLLGQGENLTINVGSISKASGKTFIISALFKYLSAVNKRCLYVSFGYDSEYIPLAQVIHQLKQNANLANITNLKINVQDTVNSMLFLELSSYLEAWFDFIFIESFALEKSAMFFNLLKASDVSFIIAGPDDTKNKIEWLANDMNNLNLFPNKIIYNSPKKNFIKSIFSVESYNK